MDELPVHQLVLTIIDKTLNTETVAILTTKHYNLRAGGEEGEEGEGGREREREGESGREGESEERKKTNFKGNCVSY